MKKNKPEFSLSLTSDEVLAEVEHHFEEDSLLSEIEQIDDKVKISKAKTLMEFIIEKNGPKVDITCGGTKISVYKSDFIRELGRFFARTSERL